MIRHHLIAIATWLLILAGAGYYTFSSVVTVSDLSLFLDGDDESGVNNIIDELASGSSARMILVGVKGAPAERLAKTSVEMANALRRSGKFEYVLNGSSMGEDSSMELLFRNRYLLSPQMSENRFDAEQLKKEFTQRLKELSSFAGLFGKARLTSDPTAEFRAIIERMRGDHGQRIEHGVWFSPDGKRAMMIASARASAFDIDRQHKLIELIRNTFDEANSSGNLEIELSGTGVFAVKSRAIVRAEAGRMTLAATFLAITFLLAVFRSVFSVVLAALPMLTGVVVAIGATQLVFGYVHGITIAFGATIIGVGVDYPIHVLSHKKRNEPAGAVWRRIGPTLALSALTTSIGYCAMVFSDFSGLRQLGLFSVFGVLSAAAASRWVLPMTIADGFSIPSLSSGAAGVETFTRLLRPLTPAMVATAIICAVLITLGARSGWNDDLSKLNPVPAKMREMDTMLRSEMNAPDAFKFITVTARDPESALRSCESLAAGLDKLVSDGSLGGYDMAARYLPSASAQTLRQAMIPDERRLRDNLTAAIRDLPFEKDAFEPFIRDVTRAATAPPVGIEDLRGTAIWMRIAPLLKNSDGKWTALIPLRDVRNESSLIKLAGAASKTGIRYINLKRESTRRVGKYRNEALAACMLGTLAILAVLSASLRSITDVGRVVITVAGPVMITAYAMSLWDGGLSIFHFVSLLLVAGLGIDYALFLNRDFSSEEEKVRSVMSTWICNVSTIMVFGALAMSSLFVLNTIGSTVFMGSALCFLFGLAMKKTAPQRSP